MFATFHGEHIPSRHARKHDLDAYALFVQHSLAMGWMAETDALWQMNDAGWDHPAARPADRLIAWFQVDASLRDPDAPLPVQALLRCALDVVRRGGEAVVDAVQILLPTAPLQAAASSRRTGPPTLQSRHWFTAADPADALDVELHLSSGSGSADALPSVLDWLSGLDQDVIRLLPGEVSGAAPVEPFDATFWGGPAVVRQAAPASLVEWTPESIGWVGELVAEHVAARGGTGPVLLTIARRPSPSPGQAPGEG
ncbi:hypothetical protein GCM10027425_31660 [Alteromonas gracilis]